MDAVAGLSERELARVRGRLVEFSEEMFAAMKRKDQRRWGECYLRGLMLDGKRKSIEPMAARLADGDEQCLQQFVNQSPWDPMPVRRALARRMSRELAPDAWVIDDTGFPKFGKMSVGVARQYSGALGKIGNCQIGVSINAACEDASCPLNWRLFIPKEWDEDSKFNRERREKTKLPEDVHHIEKWRLALEMIDELISWGIKPPPILGDGAYGDTTELRTGLEERELEYVLDVKGTTSAYREEVKPSQPPKGEGRGRPPGLRYREDPSSLKELALAAGKKAAVTVTWREGTRGKMNSRFLALRVRPANIELRRARPQERRGAARPLADLRVALQRSRADQVLALQPARRHHAQAAGAGWRRCASGSSRTTASSKTRSAWITSKAAPTAAGTTTSRSSRSRKRS